MQTFQPQYSRNSCGRRHHGGFFFLIPLFFVFFFLFRMVNFWLLLFVIFIVIIASKPRYYNSNYYQPRDNSYLNNYPTTQTQSQKVQINYCKNCGSFLEQNSLFCSECGHRL